MKQEDIKHLNDKELKETIVEEKSELQKLKFMKTVSSVENSAAFKVKRKTIARLLTEAKSRKANSAE